MAIYIGRMIQFICYSIDTKSCGIAQQGSGLLLNGVILLLKFLTLKINFFLHQCNQQI